MDAPALRLNPALDAASHREAYLRDGVVQIRPLFEPDVADKLAAVLEQAVPWDLIHSDEAGKEQVLDQAAVRALGREELTRRMQQLHTRARDAFAYVYLGYPMIAAYIGGRDPGHPLHQVTEFLNSAEFLEFGRRVTNDPTIVKADAQATFYRPGDFLNLHDDTGVGERRAAYTIGFTRRWRPDWGGQLLFHSESGEITRGLQPGFNVLTLFKVPRQHSVAPVANYAGAPRLSITGWLRDDPKGAAAR